MFHLLEPPCSDLCSIYTLTVRSVPVTQETHNNLEPIQTVRETIENSNAEEMWIKVSVCEQDLNEQQQLMLGADWLHVLWLKASHNYYHWTNTVTVVIISHLFD